MSSITPSSTRSMSSTNPSFNRLSHKVHSLVTTSLIVAFLLMTCPSVAPSSERLGPDQLLQHEDLGQRGEGIPLENIWAHERKPKLKPRKKDMFEPKLMALLGKDYETRWMKRSRDPDAIRTGSDEYIDRKTVRTLRALVNSSSETEISPDDDLRLPESLPPEYREVVKSWLIRRVTCPVKYQWHELGELWYPRWVSKGACVGGGGCSWPPGMQCRPSGTKVLYVLKWHCRKKKPKKRKKAENRVNPKSAEDKPEWKRMRQRHSCAWLKVPFPVTSDCSCSCRG